MLIVWILHDNIAWQGQIEEFLKEVLYTLITFHNLGVYGKHYMCKLLPGSGVIPVQNFFLILPSKIQFPKFLTLELSVCEGMFKVYLSSKPEKQQ